MLRKSQKGSELERVSDSRIQDTPGGAESGLGLLFLAPSQEENFVAMFQDIGWASFSL